MTNSVTFPVALGGDGKTYTDDADPETGLDGLGYTVRFIPCLEQAVVMALSAKDNAEAAASFAAQCQTLRNAVSADRQAVANDRTHVNQQRNAVDAAAQEAAQSAASVDANNIVHAPGSGLPNEAGSAAYRDVGASLGDVLVVGGGGGFLSNGESASDPDIATPNAFFYIADNDDLLPNLPLSGVNGGNFTCVSVQGTNANNRMQIGAYTSQGDGSQGNAPYFRKRWQGGWQPWSKMYNQHSILGTVSQSGGVPTGAIIERDSNDFGRWVKFADGSIFFSSLIEAVDIDVPLVVGNIYRSSDLMWTLPQSVFGPVSAWGRVTNAGAGIGVHVAGAVTGGVVSSISAIRAYIDSSGGLINRQIQLSGWATWY